jgi:hypothetical protein
MQLSRSIPFFKNLEPLTSAALIFQKSRFPKDCGTPDFSQITSRNPDLPQIFYKSFGNDIAVTYVTFG